jgi:hypothetical protein
LQPLGRLWNPYSLNHSTWIRKEIFLLSNTFNGLSTMLKRWITPKKFLNLKFDSCNNINLFKLKIRYISYFVAQYQQSLPETFMKQDMEVVRRSTYGRHFIFATIVKIKLLKKEKRCYVDGTIFVTRSHLISYVSSMPS